MCTDFESFFDLNGLCLLIQIGCGSMSKINTSFDYHNIGWNEWTSQNNCLELDLHIDVSESLKKYDSELSTCDADYSVSLTLDNM